MKAFSKENNLKGLEMQGLLKPDMHALCKHFPNWHDTVTTHPSSEEYDSDPNSHEDPDAESEENDGDLLCILRNAEEKEAKVIMEAVNRRYIPTFRCNHPETIHI